MDVHGIAVEQTLRYALYGKDRRTFLTHGGDWYERIREYFHAGQQVPFTR